MASTFNKFNAFVQNLATGAVNLSTDTINVMLSNTVPLATNSVYGDVSGTELASGNGYSTGGSAAARVSAGQVSGLYKLVLSSVVFTAAGPVGPFRYAIAYSLNTSVVTKPLIGWWDNGSPVSLTEGGTFTVAFDATLGAVSLQ